MINNHIIKTSIFAFFVCALSASVAPLVDIVGDAANALNALSRCVKIEANASRLLSMSAPKTLEHITEEELKTLTYSCCILLNIYSTRMDTKQKNEIYRLLNEANNRQYIATLPSIKSLTPEAMNSCMKDNTRSIDAIFKKVANLRNMPNETPEITLIHGLNGIGMLTDGTNEEVAEAIRQL